MRKTGVVLRFRRVGKGESREVWSSRSCNGIVGSCVVSGCVYVRVSIFLLYYYAYSENHACLWVCVCMCACLEGGVYKIALQM